MGMEILLLLVLLYRWRYRDRYTIAPQTIQSTYVRMYVIIVPRNVLSCVRE